jgi:single-strand DNA-binding protein
MQVVTILSLATKRSWRDRETGERQSQTTWHRCIVFGKLAEFAATLAKGESVDVTKSITEVRFASLTKLNRPGTTAQAVPASEEAPV